MRYSKGLSALLIMLFLSWPLTANADIRTCKWTIASFSLLNCLHNTKHKINDIWDGISGAGQDTWDQVEATYDSVAGETVGGVLWTVKEIDTFLKTTETQFLVTADSFNQITGATLDSINTGISAVQPIIEDEFLGAQAFLGTDPGGCGAGSGCAVFRNDMKNFLLDLHVLSMNLAGFYDSIPPSSSLTQVEMFYDLIDYMPGYFLYPMARAMQLSNLTFPDFSRAVTDLTDDVLVMKQAAGSCAFIINNKQLIEDRKANAYGVAIFVKGLGLAFKAKSKTVQTTTTASAMGTAGTAIKVDGAGVAASIIGGVADAALAVLGATTSKVHYCELMDSQNSLSDQLAGIDGQFAPLASQLVTLNGQLTTLDGQFTDFNAQLASLRSQLGGFDTQLSGLETSLSGEHTGLSGQLVGLTNQLGSTGADLNSQHSQLGGQLSNQHTEVIYQFALIKAQLEEIKKCISTKDKKSGDDKSGDDKSDDDDAAC